MEDASTKLDRIARIAGFPDALRRESYPLDDAEDFVIARLQLLERIEQMLKPALPGIDPRMLSQPSACMLDTENAPRPVFVDCGHGIGLCTAECPRVVAQAKLAREIQSLRDSGALV